MAKGGRKTSLKAALSSQQQRLKKKQEITQAAQVERNTQVARTKAKGKAKDAPHRPATIPFSATDNILLIGEGNFSFAHALVVCPPAPLEFLPPKNITATAYDTEEECYGKYPEAHGIVGSLREKGVEVLFGVDATALEKCSALKGRRWDRIVWNFPHAGKGITDMDRNILSNQVMLLGFLRSAASFLVTGPLPIVHESHKRKINSEDDSDNNEDQSDTAPRATTQRARGTILITLRNVSPYTLWDLPKLAKHPPPPSSSGALRNPQYVQLRSFVFRRDIWAGYEHRMTKGERVGGHGKTGEGGEDRTWEFCLQDAARPERP